MISFPKTVIITIFAEVTFNCIMNFEFALGTSMHMHTGMEHH